MATVTVLRRVRQERRQIRLFHPTAHLRSAPSQCPATDGRPRCPSASSNPTTRSASSQSRSAARPAVSCSASSCAHGSTRSPSASWTSHYAKAVADLDEHDLSMLAAWHASLEVGQPIANRDFLVNVFPTPRREPPRGAEDRRRVPRRRGVRGRRRRGAGAGDRPAAPVARPRRPGARQECLELYLWDRLGSDN